MKIRQMKIRSTMNKRYFNHSKFFCLYFHEKQRLEEKTEIHNKYLISSSQSSNVQLDTGRAYHRYTPSLHHPSTFDSSQRHLTFVHSLPPSPSCVSGQISIHARL